VTAAAIPANLLPNNNSNVAIATMPHEQKQQKPT